MKIGSTFPTPVPELRVPELRVPASATAVALARKTLQRSARRAGPDRPNRRWAVRRAFPLRESSGPVPLSRPSARQCPIAGLPQVQRPQAPEPARAEVKLPPVLPASRPTEEAREQARLRAPCNPRACRRLAGSFLAVSSASEQVAESP